MAELLNTDASDEFDPFGGYLVVSVSARGHNLDFFISRNLMHMPFFKAGHVVVFAQGINVATRERMLDLKAELAKAMNAAEDELLSLATTDAIVLAATRRASEIARMFPIGF
jgi:hypothetical protein